MKVILSAFSCGPDCGSEPAVGWNWLLQIAKHHEVWLVTTDEFRQQVEQKLPANAQAVFIPSFSNWSRLLAFPVPGLDWVYYYWWQFKAFRKAKRLHKSIGFDLAHHVTFVSWRAPSFLCLLGIPFIWGPVGGGTSVPPGLRGELGFKGGILEWARGISQRLSWWDPFVRMTIRKAAVVLPNTQETADHLPGCARSKVRLFFGIGLSASEAATCSNRSDGLFRILMVGQLRPLKGGTLAIKALAGLLRTHPNAHLTFIGEGKDSARLVNLAKALRVKERVEFLGALPREQVLEHMASCDVLLFPSLRDSGGMAVLEAMLQQKPVVCLDWGGPGFIVDETCGMKIKPESGQQVVEGLVEALRRLADSATLRASMGARGKQKVLTEFCWEQRGRLMLGIYERAVEEANRHNTAHDGI